MIKITAKEFARVVNGEINGIDEEEVLNYLPTINSKHSTYGNSFAAILS